MGLGLRVYRVFAFRAQGLEGFGFTAQGFRGLGLGVQALGFKGFRVPTLTVRFPSKFLGISVMVCLHPPRHVGT